MFTLRWWDSGVIAGYPPVKGVGDGGKVEKDTMEIVWKGRVPWKGVLLGRMAGSGGRTRRMFGGRTVSCQPPIGSLAPTQPPTCPSLVQCFSNRLPPRCFSRLDTTIPCLSSPVVFKGDPSSSWLACPPPSAVYCGPHHPNKKAGHVLSG